jgi:trimeric autotransporter adhesin
MSSSKNKLRLAGSCAALLIFAAGVGCTGFFVNPTISSLAVGPASPTIETGNTNNTVQMTVFGTNSDGSTASNPSVSWSITPTSSATISSTGLVTSVAVGTATVTAASNQNPSITGTATVTVTVGCITAIALSEYSGSVSANSGTTQTITAEATTCNGSQPVTDVATWTSSNTSLATVAGGVVSAVAGITSGGNVQITASIGNITSPPATIAVTP